MSEQEQELLLNYYSEEPQKKLALGLGLHGLRPDEVMVGIRCNSCSFSAVIFEEVEDDDCPECELGILRETSVLAADDS